MILVGQYDSPFVRRVAVAMNLMGLPFERRVLSVFTDFDDMLRVNPLGKVPALRLDGGEWLFDSRFILDYLEQLAPEEKRLIPSELESRQRVLRVEAVALGLAEKCYERGIEFARRQSGKVDELWAERLRTQIVSALGWLDALQPEPWLCGETMSMADITCAVAFTFLREKQQIPLADGEYPALARHCDHCENLRAFRDAAYSAAEAARSGWRSPDHDARHAGHGVD